MKVLMLMPNMAADRSADALPPLAFAVLAGLTPKEHEIAFFDERIEPVPTTTDAELVAISVQTYAARRAYELADSFRAQGKTVVLGGYHPTAEPDEASAHADAVVVGPGETVWPKLLDDFARGALERRYIGPPLSSLAGVSYPRDIYRGKRYGRVAPIEFGRGCRFACDFCSVSQFHGGAHHQRPTEEVVEEIERIDRKWLLFVDDNLYANPNAFADLMRAMARLRRKRRWGCQISVDVTRNPEHMRLLRHGGCAVALIGFESMEEENLAQMRKGAAGRSDYGEAIATLARHGIMTYGSFVFGYDGDAAGSFEKVVAFVEHHKMFLANFNTLTPMPGTRLYRRLETEGRLVAPRWWLDPSFQYGEVAFEPVGMSADTLKQGCVEARRRFCTARSVLKRMSARATLTNPGNLALFLLANRVFRKEISRKMRRLADAQS